MKLNLFLTLMASPCLLAQTTITKAFNDPVVGDVVNNQQVVGTVDNTASGAGVTYNNASLTGGAIVATTFSAPTSAEISSYPGTTIKSTDGVNTSFLKQSATKLELTAMVTSQGTINFNADNATAMSYPLAFGNSVNDQAKGTFTSSAANGLVKGNVLINADANGTLIIGSNTYTNILRVKTTQNFNLYQSTDTFYTFPVGTITGTTYQYYNGSSKFPLLSHLSGNISVPLLGINQSTTEAVAQGFTFLGTKDFQFVEDFMIYPNPAQDFIQIKTNTKESLMATIYSLEGRKIKSMPLKDGRVEITDLSPATYLLEVKGKTFNKTVKFIKNE